VFQTGVFQIKILNWKEMEFKILKFSILIIILHDHVDKDDLIETRLPFVKNPSLILHSKSFSLNALNWFSFSRTFPFYFFFTMFSFSRTFS
jgi:hypothetical protein